MRRAGPVAGARPRRGPWQGGIERFHERDFQHHGAKAIGNTGGATAAMDGGGCCETVVLLSDPDLPVSEQYQPGCCVAPAVKSGRRPAQRPHPDTVLVLCRFSAGRTTRMFSLPSGWRVVRQPGTLTGV